MEKHETRAPMAAAMVAHRNAKQRKADRLERELAVLRVEIDELDERIEEYRASKEPAA